MSGDKQQPQQRPSQSSDTSTQPQAPASFADRVIARARELHNSDAFAAPVAQMGNLISAAQAKHTTKMHSRNNRRIITSFVIAGVVILLISLLLPYYGVNGAGSNGEIYTPDKVFAAYGLWFQINVLPLFSASAANHQAVLLNQFSETWGVGAYTLIISRAAVTLLVILIGIMLALSGMLFQTSFRNPLAAPTMLGVSDGITLGTIVYVMAGGYLNISENPGFYAILVYGFGALCVIFVLLASRILSGGKRYNVMDMLLMGTVVCQLLGGVCNYIQIFIMDDNTWENFYNVQQAADALTEPVLQVIVVVTFIITFALVFIFRFRLNLIALSNDEAELIGVRPGLLRGFALVIGSLMQLVALASIGQVAMLSMAVPFLVRFLMPADFRSQFLGNCLLGSTLLLICLVCQHFFVIGYVTMPVGTIVSIVIVPFFVWILAICHGKWV